MSEAADAQPARKKPKLPIKPDFTKDPKYEKLVPYFNMSLSEMNKSLRCSDMQAKAAELAQAAGQDGAKAGQYLGWEKATAAVLAFVSASERTSPTAPHDASGHVPAASAPAAGASTSNAAPAAAVELEATESEEDQRHDEQMAKSMEMISAVLEDETVELTDGDMQLALLHLNKHMDQVEEAMRESFDELTGRVDATVEDVNLALMEAGLGVRKVEAAIFRHKLDPASPAAAAHDLVQDMMMVYSSQLDDKVLTTKGKLLAAYTKVIAKEQSAILFDNIRTQNYTNNGILPGRRRFLTYLGRAVSRACTRSVCILIDN
jgi:hypothetical protein